MDISTNVAKSKQNIGNKVSRKRNYNFSYEETYNYSIIILISAFLIVIPFFRGLYFRENYIPSIIYTSGVFAIYILYKFTKKDYKFFNSYLDIAMLLMPVAYLISFFFSVNAREAFDAVLKYTGYFMIYKITSDLCRETIYKKVLDYVVITAMLVIAATGIMTALGYLDLKGVIDGKRIFGLYQYANATASAMGAAIFITMGYSMNSSKVYEKLYYSLVLAVAFPVFVLTLSRGAYVIFAVLAIFNIIMLDARKRVQYVYIMLSLVATNGMFILKYYSAEKSSASTGYFMAAVISFFALQVIYEKLLSKPISRMSNKAANLLMSSVLIVSILVAGLLLTAKVPIEYRIEHASGEEKTWKIKELQISELMPDKKYSVQFYTNSIEESNYTHGVVVDSINERGERSTIIDKFSSAGKESEIVSYGFVTKADTKNIALLLYNKKENGYIVYKDIRILDSEGNVVKKFDRYKYLPEALENRLRDINLETESASLRTYFFKDGIKIVKDYFLFGTGGGGWQSLYRQYQSLAYDSKEAHNFYLQYGIETGVFGIVILLIIYYLVFKKAYKAIFKSRAHEQLPLYLALFMMMGHAAMDFDLSLTALAFLFWMLIGMISVKENGYTSETFNNLYMRTVVLLSTIAVIYLSSSTYLGMLQGKEAVSLINNDVNKSVSLYESAIRKDPYNTNYYLDYMQLMYNKYKSTHNSADLGKFQTSMDKMLKMDVSDTKQSTVIVNLLLNSGKLDKAIEVVNDMVNSSPMVVDVYTYKVDVNYEIAKHYFQSDEYKASVPYLKNILEAEQQFNDVNKRTVSPMEAPKKLAQMSKLAQNWLKQVEERQQN